MGVILYRTGCLFPALLLAVCCFFFSAAFAQTTHQLTIVAENDGLISVNNDGYYTNGLHISYQWQKNRPLKKNTEQVNNIRLGHNIYTSRFSGEFYEKNLDRPITGYLFGDFHQTLYNEKQRLLKWGIGAGLIGPHAYGREIQSFVHELMQIYKPTFWDLQLHDAFGVTADVAWSPQLTDRSKKSKFDLKPLLSATAGNLFTHAGAGAALVYGRFNANNATAFWNNHRGTGRSDREIFVYLFPTLYFKAYDATVQGGMFNNKPEAIQGKLNPLFLNAKLGATYAGNKLSLGAAAVYESKQSLTQFSPQVYGSVQVALTW